MCSLYDHQGFGTIRTSNIIPLTGLFDVFLYEESLTAYSYWSHCFVVEQGSTVVVTLVWNDPPASSYCDDGGRCLIHDLDLNVSKNDVVYYPNFGGGTGDFEGRGDTRNNGMYDP